MGVTVNSEWSMVNKVNSEWSMVNKVNSEWSIMNELNSVSIQFVKLILFVAGVNPVIKALKA